MTSIQCDTNDHIINTDAHKRMEIPKVFRMIRNGVIIANGVRFNNDQCVVQWTGAYSSIVIWLSFNDLRVINGSVRETLFQEVRPTDITFPNMCQ